MFVRENALLSIEWPDVAGGRYYWTHTMYVDTDDWPNNSQLFLDMTGKIKLVYTSQVKLHGHRLIDPLDQTVIATQTFTTAQNCSLSPVDDYTILAAARWRITGDDGSPGYHLHRYPVDVSWVVGEQFTSTALTAMAPGPGTMYTSGEVRTLTGAIVTGWAISPDVVDWQLRHGTKRKNSRFWLP